MLSNDFCFKKLDSFFRDANNDIGFIINCEAITYKSPFDVNRDINHIENLCKDNDSDEFFIDCTLE